MLRSFHVIAAPFLALVLVGLLFTNMDSHTLGNNDSKTVQLYDGGKLIGQWTTKGSIDMPRNGHGAYYFRDAATGHLVQVTGTVVITAW